jgi:hypothetical protein
MKYLRDSGGNQKTATEANGTSIGHELDMGLTHPKVDPLTTTVSIFGIRPKTLLLPWPSLFRA